MTTRSLLGVLVAGLVVALPPNAGAGEKTVATFSGFGDDYNLSFSVNGAWELRWRVEGDKTFPSVSQFNVHLNDAATGRFLGVIAQKTGSGSGARYIDDGGRFHLHVLGRNVRWQLDVVDLEEPWKSIPELEGAEEVGRMELTILENAEGLGEAMPQSEDEDDRPE